jgi:hypothetical protein
MQRSLLRSHNNPNSEEPHHHEPFAELVGKLLAAIKEHEAQIAQRYPEIYERWQTLMQALESNRE